MPIQSGMVNDQEAPADFGTDPAGVAARWISEIELAEKDQRSYRTRATRIIRAYKRQDMLKAEAGDLAADRKRRFGLLWSNMETLGPATMNRAPQAVVMRRYKDSDAVGRTASEVLERALNFTIETVDLMDIAKGIRTEFLLVGRGVTWCRYVPHMQTVTPEPMQPGPGAGLGPPANDSAAAGQGDDDGAGQEEVQGEPYDKVVWEEWIPDHVSWNDFLHNPARKWTEVRWVARIVYLTRPELCARFGDKIGKAVPLDHAADKSQSGDGQDGKSRDRDQQFAKATVYELWDKVSRKAYWINKSYNTAPLDQRDDPLELRDFFPCPRPCLGTTAPDSILPIPDYVYYESQARDIDELTTRIGLLTDALRLRGFYAAGGDEKTSLQNLLNSDTNTLIPVDSWAAFAERGGAKGLIEWMPLDMVAVTLKACLEARTQLIQDVYQVTGISDIMRGDVDPEETATATRKKDNWGSLRVRDKQKEMSRFFRDTLRIGAEIIATKFAPETLAQMTNVQLFPSQQAKQQAQMGLQQQAMQQQMAAQHAQATGQPPPPPPPPPPQQLQEMLSKPTWEDVIRLMRDNTLRGFRIDVETDSTIEPNDQEEQSRQIEFTEAVAKLVSGMLPLLQLAPQLLEMSTQLLLSLVRRFRAGRELEDVIERAMQQLQQSAGQGQPPQPQGKPGDSPQVQQAKAQADQTRAQASQVSAQADMLRARTGQQAAQTDAQLRAAELQAENARTAASHQADQAMHSQSLQADMQQAVLQASERSLRKEVMDAPNLTRKPGGPL